MRLSSDGFGRKGYDIMSFLFSALMGIVQGLSEFLPVSSSGHLIVAEKLLGLFGMKSSDDSLAFAVMLHLGTLIAVVAIFWRDWVDMLLHPIKNRTLLMLFMASLPALVVAVVLGDKLEILFEGWFLGISFLITAVFLVVLEWLDRKRDSTGLETVNIKDALIMGSFQAVALLPGVSRSGSTLLGGVSSGLSRAAAAKFSFMMSAPAILGSFLMEGKNAIEQGGLSSLFDANTLIGLVFAAVSGFLAIRYMLKLIQRISFYRFAVYVGIIGVLVIIMQLTGFAGFPSLTLPGSMPGA